MKRVHCDGCGCTEPEKLPKHTIKTVTALIIKDPRFPEGTDKYEADLCLNCQGRMLHQYFNVPAGGLDLPAFIGPRRNLHEASGTRPGSMNRRKTRIIMPAKSQKQRERQIAQDESKKRVVAKSGRDDE